MAIIVFRKHYINRVENQSLDILGHFLRLAFRHSSTASALVVGEEPLFERQPKQTTLKVEKRLVNCVARILRDRDNPYLPNLGGAIGPLNFEGGHSQRHLVFSTSGDPPPDFGGVRCVIAQAFCSQKSLP